MFSTGKRRVNIHGFDLPSFLRAVVGDYGGGLGNGARLLNNYSTSVLWISND